MSASRENRYLVLVESGREVSEAVAFRVSASGVTGRWPLGSHQFLRGQGFSPDGRLFVRRAWGEPVFLTDMSGASPGTPKQLSAVGYELSWSPTVPVLLLQNEYPESSVMVMDARCGGAEIQKLKLAGNPQMVNPSPLWARDGQRVALASTDTTEVVDFRSPSPTVVSVGTRMRGLSYYSNSEWSPDGRWLVGISRPNPGTWQVAGIDTTKTDWSILPMTEVQKVQISYVTWANPDWLFFPTQSNEGNSPTYAVRTDVLPATDKVEIPSSARLSPAGDWVAYLGDCGVPSSPGICLVELRREGPSNPVQVATGAPGNLYWTPDGKHLEYTVLVGPPGRYEWWVIPNVTAGGSPVRFAPADAGDVSWSPHSDWCSWRVIGSGVEKLYAYSVASASTQLLVTGATGYRTWSEDGAFLAVLTEDGTQVIVFHEQDGTLVELARITSTTGMFDEAAHWQPVPR